MKKYTCSISGMHCASCEVIIERAIRKVSGVCSAHVSRAHTMAEVECEDFVLFDSLAQAVSSKGYTLHLKSENEISVGSSCSVGDHNTSGVGVSKKSKYIEIGVVAVILLAVYFVLSKFELLSQFGVTNNMSYGFIFVLGLIAATSTCLAVSGGLLLAVSSRYNEMHPNLSKWQRFSPNLFFVGGRLISYAVLGGLVGYVGSIISLSSFVAGVLVFIVSLFMIVLGLQMLHIFPWLDRFHVGMPKFLAHKAYDKSSNVESGYKWYSFLFGAVTFFLPCGFTQALQLYVLGSADPMVGAMTMFIFALGTTPAFVGIGLLSGVKAGSFKRHFMTVAAVIVLFFAVMNIGAGYNLVKAGSIGSGSNDDALDAALDLVPVENGVQIASMKVYGLSYTPDEFTVKVGVPVEWRIDGRKAQGCGRLLVLPAMKITQTLSKTEDTVITFTPTQVGDLGFTCGMGMAGPGVFHVIE